MVGQYEGFADVLESQLVANDLRPLRESLSFMLENKSLEESTEILSLYVNSEQNLNTLLRMIRLKERMGAWSIFFGVDPVGGFSQAGEIHVME